MATIRATVRRIGNKIKTNKERETLVYLQYVHNGRNFTINTGVRIPPGSWRGDKDQNNPVGGDVKGRKPKNDTIKAIRRKIEHAVAELQYKNIEPTIESVKQLLEKHENENNIDVFALFERYILDSEPTKAKSTVEGLIRSKNNFIEFCRYRKGKPELESINLTFYNAYVKYLLEKRKMNNNTTGKEVKNLKSFLHHCEHLGFAISPDVKKFKVFKEKPIIVYLTQEELDRLYHFDFSTKPRLDRARDLFCLGCYTGLRWSDLSRLSKDHIEGNIIRMRAHKNKNDTLIPLVPRSAAILEKYGYSLLLIAEQNLNFYIKEACQLAGIDRPVERAVYHGGKKTYTRVPKYQEVTTHTAVKTFITHCGEKGISAKVVSQITGKTVKVILDHYYGIDQKTIISEMARAFGTV